MTDRESKPERLWTNEYGKQWTEENHMTVAEIDELYLDRFGVSRLSLLERFLGNIDNDARILEVGANIGTQLLCLSELGFTQLYGIDIQQEAIEEAHQQRPQLDIIEGNIFDIPFKTDFFDLVFTNGVLIHVPEEQIDDALDEICRCSCKYIYGHEYYADEYTEIPHRGYEGVLWKADFPSLYLKDRDLELVDIEYLQHIDNENVDVEYLLKHS